MPRSEHALEVDKIQKALVPRLRDLGFRVRGRIWNRLSSDGLTQVVGVQMGSFDPPGTTYIPGLRENLHGLFTVNLGVYVPEVAQSHTSGPARSWVSDSYCSLRTRLARETQQGKDIWWHAKATQAVIDDVANCIETAALPFFERFSTREKIIAECAGESERCSEFGGPPRIVCAIILATQGHLDTARQLLRRQAEDGGYHPSHATYVRELARRIGVGDLDG